MSDSTLRTSPEPETLRDIMVIRQPPHYTSGRFSAHNLSPEALDVDNQHDAETRRGRSPTPRPNTPPEPSSASTVFPASCSAPASVILGDHTHLTIPSLDDEDECGIVRSIAILNPFKTTFGGQHALLNDHCAMDILLEGDKAATTLSRTDLPNGADSRPFPDALSVQGLNELGFGSYLAGPDVVPVSHANGLEVDKKPSTFEVLPEQGAGQGLQTIDDASTTEVGKEGVAEEESPAGEDSPAEEDSPAGDKGGSGDPFQDDLDPDMDDETNSDWDTHEQVEKHLEDYNEFKSAIKGHEKWTDAQAHLHKLIALRGSWPMLRRDWTFNFRTRNIYPWVYAPEGSRKKVAINARSDEFRAAKSLEALFDLSALICSYRQIRMEARIGPVLTKALERHIDWAMHDAGVSKRIYIPTLQVYEFDPAAYDMESGDEFGSDSELDSDPISDEVEKRLRRLAAKHRLDLVLPGRIHLPEAEWEYRSPPPLLFAFVVVQHMVMIINLDSSHPENEIIVFVEINMSEADQWLWNALAVTLPVQVARDALWAIKDTLPEVEMMEVDDPDI